jgi:hypothetical protein
MDERRIRREVFWIGRFCCSLLSSLDRGGLSMLRNLGSQWHGYSAISSRSSEVYPIYRCPVKDHIQNTRLKKLRMHSVYIDHLCENRLITILLFDSALNCLWSIFLIVSMYIIISYLNDILVVEHVKFFRRILSGIQENRLRSSRMVLEEIRYIEC